MRHKSIVAAVAIGLAPFSAFATDPPNNQTGVTSHDNPANNRSADKLPRGARNQEAREVTRQEMHNPKNNQTGIREHVDKSQATSGSAASRDSSASRRQTARDITAREMHNPTNNQTGLPSHDDSKGHGAKNPSPPNPAPAR